MKTNEYYGVDGRFHFVYVSTITDTNNVKYRYVGKHTTSNMSDGYKGSGTAIKQAKVKGLTIECKPFLFFDCEELAEIYERNWLELLESDKAVVNVAIVNETSKKRILSTQEIKERTLQGLARAKAQGKKLGRKCGSKHFDDVQAMKAQGKGQTETAKLLGISRHTVIRNWNENK
ncbi:hypothetical protein AB6E53_06700 [Vibrio breoganii]